MPKSLAVKDNRFLALLGMKYMKQVCTFQNGGRIGGRQGLLTIPPFPIKALPRTGEWWDRHKNLLMPSF